MSRCTFVTVASMQCFLDAGHKGGHDPLGYEVEAAAEGKCLVSYAPPDECRICLVGSLHPSQRDRCPRDTPTDDAQGGRADV